MFQVESLVPVPGHDHLRKMPVDFASYLLSASPPGFEFFSLRDKFVNVGGMGKAYPNNEAYPNNGFSTVCVKPMAIVHNKHDACTDFSETDFTCRRQEDTHHKNGFVQTFSKPNINQNNSLGKKRVSFADEMGMCLTTVRIMTEPSDTPPKLSSDLLNTLTQGDSSKDKDTHPLVLQFIQPASDYLAFRRKIDRECVSLENVILKDYNLLGTVKVKNISYEKSVNVRITLDNWESSEDIPAQYVLNPSAGESHYDTFSFEINVPPHFDKHQKIQFCICFDSNGRQFWDNNSGQNYTVVSSYWESITEEKRPILNKKKDTNAIFSLEPHDTEWSEFTSWNCMDDSIPYY